MRGEEGHGGDGGSGRKSGSGSSEAVFEHMLSSSPVFSDGLVGTGFSGSATAGETDLASTVDEWIRPPPPTLISKQFSGGSRFAVNALVAPERFECESENPRKMFGVVWAVDTLRASETRTDMAEGEFLRVRFPSFLSFWNN